MAYQHKDGAFSLFPNEYKREEKHPAYKGKGTIGGVEYEAALWKRTAKETGQVYLSLSIKPATERPAPRRRDDPNDF